MERCRLLANWLSENSPLSDRYVVSCFFAKHSKIRDTMGNRDTGVMVFGCRNITRFEKLTDMRRFKGPGDITGREGTIDNLGKWACKEC